ncbi:MAG: RluA family pseudouridine synthase [Alphaproteobacteria bacterium]|nr:RluA family pseudouridine synthase [Alphaproteobacteria bacterium]
MRDGAEAPLAEDDDVLGGEDAPLATGEEARILQVALGPEAEGERIDRALAQALPGMSRSRLKALIEAGAVATQDGRLAVGDPARKVRAGEVFAVAVPAAVDATPQPQAIPLAVIYEDRELVVVDKPAGMVVHPAPGAPDRTLVNALLAHCGDSLSGIGGVRRPGIVHRIDKDTSGLLVVAKTDRAHQALAAQFAAHDVHRVYEAIAWGVPSPRSGTIDAPIGRNRQDRTRMAVRGDGRRAVTPYEVTRPLGLAAALLDCQLETGRTHQIRVHMASIGHPLVGDPVYGRPTRARQALVGATAWKAIAAFGRQALHARELGFHHPRSRKMLQFSAPPPDDFASLIDAIRSTTS